MKNNYLIFFLTSTLSLFIGQAQTETFEGLSNNASTFTNNSQPFETVGGFRVQAGFPGTGASGSNKYLDNDSNIGAGTSYSIKTTNNALFTAKDVDIFLSVDSGVTVGGSGGVIIRGKQGAATVFTITKNTGIPTTFAPDNGFFNVDFATEGGVDNSEKNINTLEFELTGSFVYIAVDEFSFGPEFVVADTAPPFVQTILVAGTPNTTDDSVDFTVTFNENASNVSTDDFVLDGSGTATGTISTISGSGSVYTVTVNGISGEGTLSIDLLASTNIIDDLGNGNGTNGNTPAFTAGENHTVSACFLESFENFGVSASTFTSNGLPFVSTNGLDVFNLSNAGAGSSDQYLDNNGTGGATFSVKTSGGELFTMKTVDLYLSSIANGSSPTNNGTLTINGKVGNTTVYTISKSTGFPTSLANGDNGFFNLNFATDGASNFTTVNVDEIEIVLGASFIYLAVDHFEFCEQGLVDSFAPEVESIAVVGTPTSIASTVNFLATFNENVVNVSADDFTLVTTGTATGNITGVTGSNNAYTITVETIDGEGTIGVNLNGGTDIQDVLGNSGVLAFTGALHTVSDCVVETFESFTATDASFTSNGIVFNTTNTLAVFELNGAGTNASDFFLENGTKALGTYAINSTNGTLFIANTAQLYVSSDAAGLLPTDDGTLSIRGVKGGSTVFTIDLNSGNTTFPTSLAQGNNGFFQVDFATDGAADYSGIDIDKLEIELISTFVYLAVDDFGFCLDTTSPSVAINSVESSPTGANPIPITVTFSEPVTGFDMGDLVVTNATINSFSGSGDTYTFNIVPVANGTITVDINSDVADDASGNGNTAATQFNIDFDSTLTNVDVVLEKGLTIYPNPANTVINISNTANLELTGLQLIDVQGRTIRSQETNPNDAIQVMDISEINSGIYFIKITTDNASLVKQVIIR
ncbi:T9SS type A sorting domain-containing protein [Algibacter sp. 2305UL17-15]|uniref:T9SS type A sorting domain-containing protein n=1 Tax=Algibacter sp. 2305UL17-15 TaxID=3231268 RepID=UPI003458D5E3